MFYRPTHAAPTPPSRRRLAILAGGLAAGLALTVSGALAEPAPPTNGGNGAGQSGQCTGPAGGRPTSCQSPGGVSGR
jgi:hypothetical protein